MRELALSPESGDDKQENISSETGGSIDRLHFWQIASFFKCPVIGTCLRVGEQKRLLKKSAVCVKSASAYDIHEVLVAAGDKDTPLGRRIDRFLHRKFAGATAVLLPMEEDRVLRCFQEAWEAGNGAACLWAAAVHPHLSFAGRRKIFGVVHMSMHRDGARHMKQALMLRRLQKSLEDARHSLKAANVHRRAMTKEHRSLICNYRQICAKLAAANLERADASPSPPPDPAVDAGIAAENRRLSQQIAVLARNNGERKRQCAALATENRNLADQLAQQQRAYAQLLEKSRSVLAEALAMGGCNVSCPAFDLCKKRILIVGGRSRMEHLYRRLIEGSGGILEYHDGCVKNGVRQLESRLRRADVVICPVSCNSHGACAFVKNVAKKYGKPVHMLANFSLNAVTRVIQGAEGVNRSIGGRSSDACRQPRERMCERE